MADDGGSSLGGARRPAPGRADAPPDLEALVASAPACIALLDAGLLVVRANQALAEAAGLPAGALAGRALPEVIPGLPGDVPELLRQVLASGEPVVHHELRVEGPGGSWRHWLASFHPVRGPAGRVLGIGMIAQEITERKRTEERLAFQATHDELTGLPNRALFLDHLGMALARARRRPGSVAVLFFDLDRFKSVNDALGHEVGDRLLVEVGRRLRDIVRPADTVARFGGDEFAMLCEDLHSEREAVGIALRLLAEVPKPIRIGRHELFVTPSIGVALAGGGPGDDPEGLLRDADAAMYLAKERGKARFELYDAAMRTRARERLETEHALRRAVDRAELEVVYQPMVSLHDGSVVGAEALACWRRPDGSVVPPAGLRSLVAGSGLAPVVGSWLLGQACRQAAAWRGELGAGRPLCVSVDLSAQLAQPGLVEGIGEVVADAGLGPGSLQLEVTERLLLGDADAVETVLHALKRLGVALAIDQFGTGSSSLAMLRRFPVDALKVDRSFVAGLGRERDDTVIVAAVAGLARALGIQAQADGVETAGQLAELRALGCDVAQGAYLFEPRPHDALADLVRAQRRR
ncbi:MAG TPA: EAL domain-containing protein [Actinomycetes bacterium]|nr:EAL domain-containing protein [Actinomycetes bacterium]